MLNTRLLTVSLIAISAAMRPPPLRAEEAFYRILATTPTRITALTPDGTLTWSNGASSGEFAIETASNLLSGGWQVFDYGAVTNALQASSVPPASLASRLTYLDLIHRLVDLERLATVPSEGERCAMWSSYDRTSVYDHASGTYSNWTANGDMTGTIRQEGDQYVLAEMTGPGVIWRIWTAVGMSEHVRIYLDDQHRPTLDLPFAGYFNASNAPFTRTNLVYKLDTPEHDHTGGHNLYVPIPYQDSCRILADTNWQGKPGFGFHQVTYANLPHETVLSSFHTNLFIVESDALDALDALLAQCGDDPAPPRAGQSTEAIQLDVAPGTTALVAHITGPRAITALRVEPQLPDPPDDRLALRELALQIAWDGESQPSVWAPLGDFFGTAPGVNLYRSLPMGMTTNGFYSFWYMPFASNAVIELCNDGSTSRSVRVSITHAPLSRPLESLARFHVKWHRDADIDPARPFDWTFLKTDGAGRFVGLMLHVWYPSEVKWWWGEGDEKLFVDGEHVPSLFGTGTEDYFGFAYGSPILFARPYHGQTARAIMQGHSSLYRWHIADNVPFHSSFEGALEKYRYPEPYFPYHGETNCPTYYSCTVYWYLAPDGSDHYQPQPLSERTGYW